jgi:hypothetical protein
MKEWGVRNDLNIIRKVLIKQIITENSKAKLQASFEKKIMQLEQECQQLLFEQRKLTNKSAVSKQDITNRFKQEIQKRKEEISLIDFKIEQLEMIEIGSEIIETDVEALVEVNVGMHWNETNEQAIVIKDGIVVRIDE